MRHSDQDVILRGHLSDAIRGMRPDLPDQVVAVAVAKLTFARLLSLSQSMDDEQRRAVKEGLSEEELVLFDLLQKPNLSKKDREKVKRSSKSLLESIEMHLMNFENWTAKEQTRADVETFVIDHVMLNLPQPPYTENEAQELAGRLYSFVFQQALAGMKYGGRKAA